MSTKKKTHPLATLSNLLRLPRPLPPKFSLLFPMYHPPPLYLRNSLLAWWLRQNLKLCQLLSPIAHPFLTSGYILSLSSLTWLRSPSPSQLTLSFFHGILWLQSHLAYPPLATYSALLLWHKSNLRRSLLYNHSTNVSSHLPPHLAFSLSSHLSDLQEVLTGAPSVLLAAIPPCTRDMPLSTSLLPNQEGKPTSINQYRTRLFGIGALLRFDFVYGDIMVTR